RRRRTARVTPPPLRRAIRALAPVADTFRVRIPDAASGYRTPCPAAGPPRAARQPLTAAHDRPPAARTRPPAARSRPPAAHGPPASRLHPPAAIPRLSPRRAMLAASMPVFRL